MSTRIQPLSALQVHRIAAGEVIDSMTAVVRELVDNALDAQASRISVKVWPQDWRVQVADNGVGLTWTDLLQAALPNTTSKLTSKTALDQVNTLGFRGEALHSMTQVGNLEISSRVADTETGWAVSYDVQGSIQQANQIALAPGTVVTVSQLFAQWPSRRQVLPEAQVLRSLQSLIQDYALCHPQITWQVYRGERLWFQLAPGTQALDILLQILPQRSSQEFRFERFTIPCPDVLSEVAPSLISAEATVEVLIALPDRYHRHRSDWIRTAVNGRRVLINLDGGADTPVLGNFEQTILNAFRQTLPRHRYPLSFVHFKLPPALVDWNRTATKSHVYLHHSEQWCEVLTQQIQSLLGNVTLSDTSPRLRQLIKSAEQQGQYITQPLVNLSAKLPDVDPDPEGEDKTALPSGVLKAVAQLHNTYIVAEHPAGMWLVEQHIAHERVLYEQISQHWQMVPLEKPITLNALSDRQLQNLQLLQFSIEEFGQNLWAVRSAPQLLAQREDCEAALYELSHFQTLQPAIVATACRSAIRNGTPLSLTDMQTLLDQWQKTRSPRTCPHGRPIYLSLEETSLARFFRRHWVVGKSHGI
jgi:DNA mismatch repair protein MutL